jgi:ectoine hydroxylase-related dioxygenase (phytanoyl-CoA dioxygenase family)
VGVPESLMLQTALERSGFALAEEVFAADEIAGLIADLGQAVIPHAERHGQIFGARNLLQTRHVAAIASSSALSVHLLPILGSDYRVVRGLFFDKTEAANWPVLWHQDLSVAVQEERKIEGWTNWSMKRGVLHVQPPATILARMVTARLHLDDCDTDNGPLRVITGSHVDGVLGRDAIRARTESDSDHAILAKAGDVLFMRPLLLHASSPATRPRHRRVLHLEFAPAGLLPAELMWAAA